MRVQNSNRDSLRRPNVNANANAKACASVQAKAKAGANAKTTAIFKVNAFTNLKAIPNVNANAKAKAKANANVNINAGCQDVLECGARSKPAHTKVTKRETMQPMATCKISRNRCARAIFSGSAPETETERRERDRDITTTLASDIWNNTMSI